MASVQAGPFSALQHLLHRVLEHLKDLRPHQCFFILQAMSRLRLRHPKAGRILQQLSLAWRSLPEKKFVKAANAVAKLDLGKELWAKPLKVALEAWLPRMNGRHLANLKAIAVMELLDEPQAMHAYLEQCESLRNDIWYSRHLQVVEAHVHLLYPELWNSLDERIRLFLQTVRTAAEESRQTQAQVQERSASENSEDESDEEVQAAVAPTFDKQRFSSALHADISRMLTALGLEHSNKISAGPVLLDIVHLPSMVVVEAAALWQYYLRSPQITALARRRQEMISAMGFNLQVIPYFRWDTLKDDSAKAELLKKQLPKEVTSCMASHEGAEGVQADQGQSSPTRPSI